LIEAINLLNLKVFVLTMIGYNLQIVFHYLKV